MSNDEIVSKRLTFKQRLHRLNTKQTWWIVEVFAALIASVIIGLIFSNFGRGGPNSSDITLYMNVGMNGIKMPFILNRYFHVFLQAIFIKLAPSPLEGYHLFWGFIVGVNAFLVYLAARKTLKRSNPLHGFLAVLFYFSLAAIAETSGVVVVDFTAMTMITAFFTVYLFSLNKEHRNPWLVGLLGFLLYLGFKSKETTLPAAVLLIGLGWVGQEPFDFKRLLKNLLWVACGGLAGVVFFGLLSWMILGDPLFGLRISEWREFFGTYAVYSSRMLETLNALGDGNTDDWYQGYWFSMALMPFLLYLISGVRLSRKTSMARRILWLVPLAYTVFLIISINNRLGYETRFGLPVLPIICILAPQFIDIPWPETKREWVKFVLYLGVGFALVLGIRLVLRMVVPAQGLDLGAVVTLVYYPLLTTLLFLSLFLFRDKFLWHVVNFMIVFSLLISPISSNYRAMFVVRDNQAAFTEAVMPFADYREIVTYSPGMDFYTTSGVFEVSELRIGKNIDEVVTLFNVYFDASATREDFTFAEAPEDISAEILAADYDYALITMDEWIAMQADEVQLAQVHAQYEPNFGESGDFVLLKSEN